MAMDGILFPLILTVHILVGATVIGLVLLQHGKGADMGAAFGSGASGSLFGASGSANFLSRTTAILATVFFLTSLGLSYLATNRTQAPGSVMEQVKTQPAVPLEQVPTQPAAAADSKAKEIPK
ncbi:preprotein translocase subunit SecG [Candidatus Desulfobacillus denitrificans]